MSLSELKVYRGREKWPVVAYVARFSETTGKCRRAVDPRQLRRIAHLQTIA